MRKPFGIILMCFIWFTAYSQQNVNIEKVEAGGLTNFIIKCIQQDANGFIWLGTEEGLFRYDGYTFKAFKNLPGDNKTLINNNIEFLFPEKNLLWIGSRGGLSCIDINTTQIKNFSPAEPVKVYAIVPENDSVFWTGTATGMFQFNKNNKQWKRIGAIAKDIFIRSVCNDEKNSCLYITSHTGFYVFDKLTSACTHYTVPAASADPSSQIMHKSFIDNNGMVWMSSWQTGLVQFDPHTKEIKQWLYDKHIPVLNQPYLRAYDIVNNNGKVWIANSEKGLSIFDLSNHTITNYPVHWDNEQATINKVISLFRDRSGIWWVGTENGLYKDDPHMTHLSKTAFLLKTDSGVVHAQLSGNSAGGHLALCTALVKNWNEKTDDLRFSAVPNVLLVNSGVYALTDQNTAWVRKDLKDKNPVNEISPDYLIKKEFSAGINYSWYKRPKRSLFNCKKVCRCHDKGWKQQN